MTVILLPRSARAVACIYLGRAIVVILPWASIESSLAEPPPQRKPPRRRRRVAGAKPASAERRRKAPSV